jgi:hypothetical protein
VVVRELFPNYSGLTPPITAMPTNDESTLEVPRITDAEMSQTIKRLGATKTAPGPDGVPGRVISIALKHLGGWLRQLFDACLTSGEFPKTWKDGKLCLLQKPGRPPDSPTAYRPIILLDEVGKALERILAARIAQHLEEEGPNISSAQYGFRSRRSTIDALTELRRLSTEAAGRGELMLAVSLDIKNAFNSLPFETIKQALRFHRIPYYLRRLLEAYLQDREVLYVGRNSQMFRYRVGAGVPQGSVLGPILWNLGYDWVLRGALLPKTTVLCYADDTLVTARGKEFAETARLASISASLVVDRINMLGLEVAIYKTEALLFPGSRKGAHRGATILVKGVPITLGSHMKYLGLTLDGRWKFEEHFKCLAPRLVGTAATLGRLLPNIGGPGSNCRKLYAGIIKSMALYGAPIWMDALTAHNKILLRRPQRIIAVRAIRGYRTISWAAATALAGDPPWELQAEVLAEVYRFNVEERSQGVHPAPDEIKRTRVLAQQALMRRWEEDLAASTFGVETIQAIRPVLDRWVKRKTGALSYRLVQVLSGHGCFGRYLYQTAKREPTPICHECGAPEDTARHNLEECTAWGPQRNTLTSLIGLDLSLPSVIRSMLDSERYWSAVSCFCETIMSRKEAAERARENDAHADPIRRRRVGGRRRRYAHLMPPP